MADHPQQFAVTLDTDWAPDSAIDLAAELLVQHRVKATWFVTHASPAIARLREHPDLFEIGIHPNFLANSSHGPTLEDVLDFCMALVPDALSVRTHALWQSTPMYDLLLNRTPIRVDATLLLSHANYAEAVEYQWSGKTLLRIPYVWEDDVEMLRDQPAWDLPSLLHGRGLRVFDFHPIHVALNSADMAPYTQLKRTIKPLQNATLDDLHAKAHTGEGARTAFVALLAHLGARGGGWRMRDLYAQWQEQRCT